MQAGSAKLAILQRHATVPLQIVRSRELPGRDFLVAVVSLAIVNLLIDRPDHSRREMPDRA